MTSRHTSSLGHILIIDDDDRLRGLIADFLHAQGFTISMARNAQETRELIALFAFDALVLDVMMPGESGLELIAHLRQEKFKTPTLLLTARGDVEDRIKGFESGADDYLPKPFEPRELFLRLKSLLNRHKLSPSHKHIAIGPFMFDPTKLELSKGETIVPLTTGEATLLKIFVDHMGTYLTRESLILMAQLEASPRTIDVQITRLRKKIEDDPKQPKFLQTIRHKGYILWGR